MSDEEARARRGLLLRFEIVGSVGNDDGTRKERKESWVGWMVLSAAVVGARSYTMASLIPRDKP
jgi:hypothetical protein